MLHKSDPNRLSSRETEVLALLADDLTYAQIDQLGISRHTVHRHVSSILQKTEQRAALCHGYYWDPSISDFREVNSGWVSGPVHDCLYSYAPTTNVYGYHQIQYQRFYSSTFETHAN